MVVRHAVKQVEDGMLFLPGDAFMPICFWVFWGRITVMEQQSPSESEKKSQFIRAICKPPVYVPNSKFQIPNKMDGKNILAVKGEYSKNAWNLCRGKAMLFQMVENPGVPCSEGPTPFIQQSIHPISLGLHEGYSRWLPFSFPCFCFAFPFSGSGIVLRGLILDGSAFIG